MALNLRSIKPSTPVTCYLAYLQPCLHPHTLTPPHTLHGDHADDFNPSPSTLVLLITKAYWDQEPSSHTLHHLSFPQLAAGKSFHVFGRKATTFVLAQLKEICAQNQFMTWNLTTPLSCRTWRMPWEEMGLRG